MEDYTIKKQKRLADIVLDRLEIIDPTCIVAGGAPRDWYLGKGANDIDVYMHATHSCTDLEKQLIKLGFPPSSDIITSNDVNVPYKTLPGLRSVFYTEIEGQEVQIMHMDKPTFDDVVSKFAMSISMFWYKSGYIRAEPYAQLTLEHKIGFIHEGYSLDNRYVDKITQRFPDYSWVLGEKSYKELMRNMVRI